MNAADTNEHFKFLNYLRRSGAINMFGAGPYLQEVFDMDARTARDTLTNWMNWVSNNPNNADK